MSTDAELLQSIERQLELQRQREHDARKDANVTRNLMIVSALVNTGVSLYGVLAPRSSGPTSEGTGIDQAPIGTQAASTARTANANAEALAQLQASLSGLSTAFGGPPAPTRIPVTIATNQPATTTVAQRTDQGGTGAPVRKSGSGTLLLVVGLGLRLFGVF